MCYAEVGEDGVSRGEGVGDACGGMAAGVEAEAGTVRGRELDWVGSVEVRGCWDGGMVGWGGEGRGRVV